MKDRFIYYDRNSGEYDEINDGYNIETAESVVKYFGDYRLDDLMDSNEFIIYKLVPHVKLVKSTEYKLIKDESKK